MVVELYPAQLKAVDELKSGSILKGGVGSGKSITSIAYFYTKICKGDLRINGFGERKAMETPKDLYIITTALKRDKGDWLKEIAPFGLSTKWETSFGGVQVVIDSWNNIEKYKDVQNAFFILDEQRLVGSGAWVKSFLKIAKQNEWILLSATPGDNWMDYCPVLIANGYYKNKTDFVRQHVIFKSFSKFPQIEGYVETGRLNQLRRKITVEMPIERHTIRHTQNILVPHDKVLFEKVFKERWHIYEERPIRDIGELFILMRKLVNSDPSRAKEVIKLYQKHPRLIVFYSFNYELDILRQACEDADAPYSEWNGHKHEDIPDGYKWIYLVQYTAGAEGWNCTSTNATVFYSLHYSYKINQQAKGRIDRLNTKYVDLYYYILRSNSMIDNAIVKAIALKKDFNIKDLMK